LRHIDARLGEVPGVASCANTTKKSGYSRREGKNILPLTPCEARDKIKNEWGCVWLFIQERRCIMRKLWLFVGLIFFCTFNALALDIGDKAPPLTIEKWVKGEPVDPSKPDGKTVYVIEFWATWCPPCKQSIPHLSSLQQKFKDKGVVIVGISAEDAATVESFVQKQKNMEYRVAIDKDDATNDAWMKNVRGIPHAFIVDRNGVVVWQGHPLSGLDEALERVVAGRFDLKKAQQIKAKESELQQALNNRDIERILTIVEELIRLEPTDYRYHQLRLKVLRFKGDMQAVMQARREAADAFLKAKAAMPLNNLAWELATDGDLSMRDLSLALKCATSAVEMTQRKSAAALDTLARVYYALGMLDKAIATEKEAVAVSNENEVERTRQRLKFYQSAKKLRDSQMQ